MEENNYKPKLKIQGKILQNPYNDHKHQNKGGIWSLGECFERYFADKFIQIHIKPLGISFCMHICVCLVDFVAKCKRNVDVLMRVGCTRGNEQKVGRVTSGLSPQSFCRQNH